LLVLLSPAKSLDWSAAPNELSGTEPTLLKESRLLAKTMRTKKPRALSKLMDISEALAELNHERFQTLTAEVDPERDRPAALAFNGDVYQGLDARSLSAEDLTWAQDHIAILSGLYGVLRPLDLIEPHRLEMGTALKTRRGASLYEFWGDRVNKHLTGRLAEQSASTVVDLASQEYSRVARLKKLDAAVITPVFREESDGKAKTISFYAKRARGMMARFVIEKRLTDVDGLQKFRAGGYRFDAGASSDATWVFARPKP
jgi:cytoplasmic iron level regulating protein YaaA (DUF328/UPF0246 family)